MRLATVDAGHGAVAVAQLSNGALLLLNAAAGAAGSSTKAILDGSLQSIIAGGKTVWNEVATLIEKANAGGFAAAQIAANSVQFLAPLPRPEKNVFCVGRNYADHIAEGARAQKVTINVTEVPVYFTKPRTAVVGTGADVPLFPHISTQIDYEVELALVIGTPGRDISKDAAMDHIFGYTIINDITARDVQRRHGGQFFKGKGLDGSCPMGPWIVTADDMPTPQATALRCYVNGDLRQNGSTADMIFDIPTLIASLSQGMKLEPGDILATGTPSGVGYAMTPPQFLTDGDEVICEIDGIGKLINRVRTV
ncbi:2-keto-4-pentenoate hydratase/2-oxohepta-3-ene-1,7-dioic acid hydratase (catechol pathway) [Pseudorhodobacter antarcticus]|jgi:2-keto-4-pentenoate hydratase/2-oxohepta-3-ene-1,7-dioic acid hydratase in catechol pathway|uniref:2-keto-4-pentenoate hydratase/2-oxohepta-3-ene-1,7-dioic acid hydratase (Catechol pathway) n=1 Tax=Pseudorhodobacter antarcticus TaxID=1077947 RepID=A0A1H8LTS3_9RHOB|nr:fumarylacetoacetate hydrolase family protein [Pseudorhodobacter antarcticus]SEO08547.1 2-keto-4-pentenoate hydratase/2-oxohepta-3-ene-1,7-dioic acid hydratase (catechol pathway) [Pseudorhodobacter antarcticus]